MHRRQMRRHGAYPTCAYVPSECAMKYLAKGKRALRTLAAGAPWELPEDLATAGLPGEPHGFERTIDGIPVETPRRSAKNG
jgi:hypothetical protein